MRYLIVLLFFPITTFSQILTNTNELNDQNLYTFSVNVILDSLSRRTSGTFILEGEPSNKVRASLLSYEVLNAEQHRIFSETGLTKEYRTLIGKNLIRLRLRSTYIEDSHVKLSIFLVETVYGNRRKNSSEIFGDGLWTFIFNFDPTTNSFVIESITTGMML